MAHSVVKRHLALATVLRDYVRRFRPDHGVGGAMAGQHRHTERAQEARIIAGLVVGGGLADVGRHRHIETEHYFPFLAGYSASHGRGQEGPCPLDVCQQVRRDHGGKVRLEARVNHGAESFGRPEFNSPAHEVDASDGAVAVFAEVVAYYKAAVRPSHKEYVSQATLLDNGGDVSAPDSGFRVGGRLCRSLRHPVPPQVKRYEAELAGQVISELVKPRQVALRPTMYEQDGRRFLVAALANVELHTAGSSDLRHPGKHFLALCRRYLTATALAGEPMPA
jgi:hypothetical protein